MEFVELSFPVITTRYELCNFAKCPISRCLKKYIMFGLQVYNMMTWVTPDAVWFSMQNKGVFVTWRWGRISSELWALPTLLISNKHGGLLRGSWYLKYSSNPTLHVWKLVPDGRFLPEACSAETLERTSLPFKTPRSTERGQAEEHPPLPSGQYPDILVFPRNVAPWEQGRPLKCHIGHFW